MDEASDRELVQRTRGGDVNAFGELVQRYQASVFGVCYRLLGDSTEAEDLAQESVPAGLPALGQVRRREAFRSMDAAGGRQPVPERSGTAPAGAAELDDEGDDLPGDPRETPEQAGIGRSWRSGCALACSACRITTGRWSSCGTTRT